MYVPLCFCNEPSNLLMGSIMKLDFDLKGVKQRTILWHCLSRDLLMVLKWALDWIPNL